MYYFFGHFASCKRINKSIKRKHQTCCLSLFAHFYCHYFHIGYELPTCICYKFYKSLVSPVSSFIVRSALTRLFFFRLVFSQKNKTCSASVCCGFLVGFATFLHGFTQLFNIRMELFSLISYHL